MLCCSTQLPDKIRIKIYKCCRIWFWSSFDCHFNITCMQVDRLVGKNHLFKRSIILIKAWCYYESRILGAHHGLISTYALETLILYIFHLFHCSLNGPLAVRFRGINSGLCLCFFNWNIAVCMQYLHVCKLQCSMHSWTIEFACIFCRFSTDFWSTSASLTGRIIVLV